MKTFLRAIFVPCTLLLSLTFNSVQAQDKTCEWREVRVDSFSISEEKFYLIEVQLFSTSLFVNLESTASFLYRVQPNGLDTLLAVIPDMEYAEADGVLEPYPLNFKHEEELYELKHGYPSDDMDSTQYSYMFFTGIDHLGAGVFQYHQGYWAYTGGAHGNGSSTYFQYDLNSQSSFDLDDCFKQEVYAYIFDAVRADLPGFLEDMGMSEQEIEAARKETFLREDQYYFTSEGLVICSQGYDTLFDLYYHGYPVYSLEIPYGKLKKFMLRNSPLWRLYQAQKAK